MEKAPENHDQSNQFYSMGRRAQHQGQAASATSLGLVTLSPPVSTQLTINKNAVSLHRMLGRSSELTLALGKDYRRRHDMIKKVYGQVILVGLAIAAAVLLANCSGKSGAQTASTDPIRDNALKMVDAGKQTFRFDTFGDEAFWGDTIKLHQAIEGSAFAGGVGAGVSPKTALAVGLKVDLDAL